MISKTPKPPKISSSASNDNPSGDPKRLREIADRAGQVLLLAGRPSIIGRPGLSKSTVARIQQALYVKRSTLVAFAEAAGIRKEWLLDGTGPMATEAPPGVVAAQPDQPECVVSTKETRINGIVDLPRLGAAIRIAERVVKNPDTAEDWCRRAEAVIELYEELSAQAAADSH